jgi:hypothetical protein
MLPVEHEGCSSSTGLRRGPTYRPLSSGALSPNHFRASPEHRSTGKTDRSPTVSVDIVKRCSNVQATFGLSPHSKVIRPLTAPSLPPQASHVRTPSGSDQVASLHRPSTAESLLVKRGSGLAQNKLFVVASNPSKRSIVLQCHAVGSDSSSGLSMSPIVRSRPLSAKSLKSRPSSAASQRHCDAPTVPVRDVKTLALRNLKVPVSRTTQHAAFLSGLLSPWDGK